MALILHTRPVQLRHIGLLTTLALAFYGLCSVRLRQGCAANGRCTDSYISADKRKFTQVQSQDIPHKNLSTVSRIEPSQGALEEKDSVTFHNPPYPLKYNGTGSAKYPTKISSVSNATGSKSTDIIIPPEERNYDFKSNHTTTTSTPYVTKPLTTPPNCQRLFAGDKAEIHHVNRLLENVPYKPPPDSSFINLECEKFRERYPSQPQSKEEAEYPLAFGIRMHDKVAQAERLLRTIYMPQNLYCIYIDKKAEQDVHLAMAAIAACFDNVFIATHLEKFYYQSFSPVQADMQCMEDVLNTSVSWKYFINAVGTEFPLRTNLEMVNILKLLNGTNDIEKYPFPPRYNYRIEQGHVIIGNDTVPTGRKKRPFYPTLDLQKGCSYNLYSRAFVQWVLTDQLAQRFIQWSVDTMAPDETVWATLNHLPQAPGGYPGMVTQVSKTFLAREVIWLWSSSHCSRQHYVRAVCILSSGDLQWLSRRWEFFANKFDPAFDHIVLDCLEERHRNRTLNPDLEKHVNWDAVKRAPHVKAALQKKVTSSSMADP